MRPTWAEIHLQSLVRNYRALETSMQAHAGSGARLLAVVKANAYGHGVERCGRALAGVGAGWLGVTCVEEAVRLLEALPSPSEARLLVMSGFFAGEEDAVVRLGLRPQVWEPWHFRLLDEAARRAGRGPATVPVHLEIDTGMSRQGVAPGGIAELLRALPGAGSPVFVEGVLTHFSSPEMPETAVMEAQIDALAQALQQLATYGVRPRWVHAGNSVNAACGRGLEHLAALAARHGAELLVRPGLALYGVAPSSAPAGHASEAMPALEPVMHWCTEITSLRTVAAGTPVGYNETFRAPLPMRLATVPVGYADGLRRELSNFGAMLVGGTRAAIVGRISMDQTVLDVSGLPEVAVRDPVAVLGAQGAERITAQEHADWCGTIPYEVLCGVSARVPRMEV